MPIAEAGDLLPLLLQFRDYMVAMVDQTGVIRSWNLGGEQLYGYTSDEITGKPYATLYSPDEVAAGRPADDLRLARENGRVEWDGWRPRKDGTSFYANVILTSLTDIELNVFKGYAIVVRDITTQKELAEQNKLLMERMEELVAMKTQQLTNANRELEAFSYSVSHDLRAPLRAISGYSIMLKEDHSAALDEEGLRILNTIMENTSMMGQLIDDLLAFSRMGRLSAVIDNVDMNRVVHSCLEKLQFCYPDHHPILDIQSLPSVKGDTQMLNQVWMNLIDNAFKYTAGAGDPRIIIGSDEQQDRITYYVKDNGVGFDMRYADKLFGVFQRLHSQEEFRGTGLGLALAKRIVTKHGGEIWAEAAKGSGASFFFWLPR